MFVDRRVHAEPQHCDEQVVFVHERLALDAVRLRMRDRTPLGPWYGGDVDVCECTDVVREARLRETKYGRAADGDGWFVLSARDSRWRDYGPLGLSCNFEGKRRFAQLGVNVNVLEPGQAMALFHRENAQEAFLVVAGKCILVVEDEEREVNAWDFFHCPPRTAHVIIGAGDAPAVVVAVGARRRGRRGLTYLQSEVAPKYGASVERETTQPSEAYARFPQSRRVVYCAGMLPGG
jgi:uncharacterized cupin superfamily protein